MSQHQRRKGISTTIHELRSLIESFHPIVVMETVEEERIDSLLAVVANELRLRGFQWTLTKGLRPLEGGPPAYGTTDPLTLVKHLRGLTVDAVFHLKDFATHIDNPETRREVRELAQLLSRRRSTLVISGSAVELPEEIESVSVHYVLQLPDRQELRSVVREVIQSMRAQREPFEIDLEPDDLERMLTALQGLTSKQARQAVAYSIVEDRRLSSEDIEHILERKGAAVSEQGILEYYPAVSNQYEIGGFRGLRNWLQRARVGFSKRARKLNLSAPKGILLVGVQGCGKSLAAKYVAREWSLPLLKLDASRLYDKYVGESEKNLRKAIQQADAMAPVVLWIDEIEKAFSSGPGSESDGGLSRRIQGTFLTWMQEKQEGVFLVATANNIRLLPPEMLRKGRFDEVFFVDLPDQHERALIFKIHLGLRNQDPAEFDLEALAIHTEKFSGAEIEQVVISALYRALHDRKTLSAEMLIEAIRATVPLAIARGEEIEELRSWASDRFVKAS